MFSLIESCKLNGFAPEKYIAFLLRKLKDADEYTDKNALLPCFSGDGSAFDLPHKLQNYQLYNGVIECAPIPLFF
ncbi:MAG: transposase domain-containing protein [Bacteroidales bacterium]|nr:transposase domain-containing protein [Bacteroidales bacterium]